MMLLLLACAGEPEVEEPPVVEADADTDTDTDADADTDADSDTDTSPPDPECDLIHGEGEPLAGLSECGTLHYGLYAAEGDVEAVHRLPDFSWAGYQRGGVALPSVPVAVTLSPQTGDQRARIQDAIDTVSALTPDGDGFRGAVLLEAGTWEVSDTLVIDHSGVVLRGEGQGQDGTVLVATRAAQHTFIELSGSGSGLGEVDGSRVDIVADAPVGSHRVQVASTEGISEGDTIAVLRTPDDAWISALGMDSWGWTAGSYAIGHERTVVAIEDDELVLDIPLVDAIEARWGGGSVFRADLSGRIEQVGVEHLRLVSEHAGSTDEDHGWKAVRLSRVTNGWVQGVTAQHFGYAAVSIEAESSFNTVQDTAMLEPVSQVTGGRRYSFNVSDGIGNLFQRCYSEEARHDFVTGSRVTGPNVWLDSLSLDSTNDDGPHHRWSTGVLLDNVLSFKMHVENRQDSGSGHGWSGAQVLFWNGLAEAIRCDAPRGAMNWTVGCVGEQTEGGWTSSEPYGWWESHKSPVEPRSLYLKQLEDRLGAEAVQAVTLPEQREGRIWGLLASWAGEGELSSAVAGGDPECATGIVSGISCCEAGCGSCGGEGCGGRPGGAEACCTGSITESGTSCAVDGPPCVVDPAFSPVGQ